VGFPILFRLKTPIIPRQQHFVTDKFNVVLSIVTFNERAALNVRIQFQLRHRAINDILRYIKLCYATLRIKYEGVIIFRALTPTTFTRFNPSLLCNLEYRKAQ